jgi:hypothetical protein
MPADPPEDLLTACVAFMGIQRRVIDCLVDAGRPIAVEAAMTAELDRLAAAVRQAQQRRAARRDPCGGDPGE